MQVYISPQGLHGQTNLSGQQISFTLISSKNGWHGSIIKSMF